MGEVRRVARQLCHSRLHLHQQESVQHTQTISCVPFVQHKFASVVHYTVPATVKAVWSFRHSPSQDLHQKNASLPEADALCGTFLCSSCLLLFAPARPMMMPFADRSCALHNGSTIHLTTLLIDPCRCMLPAQCNGILGDVTCAELVSRVYHVPQGMILV